MIMNNGIGKIKMNNRALILKFLRKNGPMSRKDLAQCIGITPAAVTILSNEMIEENILVEMGEMEEENKRAGRKKILININYDYKYVIGINIESNYINIGVSNLKGKLVENKIIKTNSTLLPEDMLKDISNYCISMLWKNNISKQDVIGVGVGVFGHVDSETGISKKTYNLWNRDVNIKSILERELQLPAVVDNNVRALAIGEMDYGIGNGIKDMIFIKHGPGVGAAIVINNQIYYGQNNKVGEIGHTIVDLNGKKCKCGKKGCLETICSESAIVENVKNIFSKSNTPKLYDICEGNTKNINMNTILQGVDAKEEQVLAVLQNVASKLALAIVNSINIIDPQKVILYGQIFKNKFFYRELLKDLSNLCQENIDTDFICLSNLNIYSNYIGAIAIAIRKLYFEIGGMEINLTN